MGAASVLRPSARRDWWVMSRDYFDYVRGVPGVDNGPTEDTVLVHRTHLPLLPEGLRISVSSGNFSARTTPHQAYTLRPHQAQAVEFIRSRRRSLVADEPRIGKTCELVSAHNLDEGQLLVVGPLQSRFVWMDWFHRRWPDVKPEVVTGRTFDRQRLMASPLTFIHYELLPFWATFSVKPALVAFDEAHRLANHKALSTQGALTLISQAERVVFLTGTPSWNRPSNLFTLLHLLTPNAWGSFKDFGRRYADGRQGAYGFVAKGVSHNDEFQRRMIELKIERKWRDINANVPAINRSIEIVDISIDDTIELDKWSADAAQGTSDRTTIGEMARLRRLLGNFKIKRAVELAASLHACGEPVVLWCWHQDVVERLRTALSYVQIPAYGVTGGSSATVRQQSMEAWRKTGGALAINLAVGGTAIDLSAARHCIFVELDYTPLIVSQAEMRTFAPTRPMTSTFLVSNHEVEMRLVAALLEKLRRADKTGMAAGDSELSVLREALEFGETFDVMAFLAATGPT